MNLSPSSDMPQDLYLPIAAETDDNQPSSHCLCLKEPTAPVYAQDATIERIDDIPLLMALQQRIDLATVIDSAIARHWSHQGLSIGQLVVGWSTFILSEADHRKVTVQKWVADHQAIVEQMLAAPIRDTDFTDDRLGQVLTHLSDDGAWHQIEARLWRNSVSVYRISPQRVRLDATRINGHHAVTEDGLMQHGYNPNAKNQSQVKLMAASIDTGTNGHLVMTDVVSGEKADDPLYLPAIDRIRQTLDESGLLYIGDSKMCALSIRANIARNGDFYLVPLANVGEVPKVLDQAIGRIVDGQQPATLIFDNAGESNNPRLIAAGYQTTRKQSIRLPTGGRYTWTERLLVIRSPAAAKKQMASLNKRLADATEALMALTPEPGRGRRQIRDEDQLRKKAEAIVSRFSVTGYLHYTFMREEQTQTQYVGRGRGGKNRKRRTITTVRYQMTEVIRDEAAITDAFCRMGWRLLATNMATSQLSFQDAVVHYRQAPRIERHFHLFKDAPVGISPLYVRRDDQIKGLIRLLSLCVRLMTLIEIVVRRHLDQQEQFLVGLYEGNPKKPTAVPTAKRLLKAFGQINRLRLVVGDRTVYYVTPLTEVQRQILSLLELSEAIYSVPIQNSG